MRIKQNKKTRKKKEKKTKSEKREIKVEIRNEGTITKNWMEGGRSKGRRGKDGKKTREMRWKDSERRCMEGEKDGRGGKDTMIKILLGYFKIKRINIFKCIRKSIKLFSK